MSMSLYTGTPGSYKSCHATEEIINTLKSGRNVISNYPVDYTKVLKKGIKGEFVFIDNFSLTPRYLVDYAQLHHKSNFKAQTLVVIDEASIIFNSREFNRKDRSDWIKFFAQHRHFNYDVLLITQDDKMIDKQIRSFVEYEYKHRALKNYNLITWLISKCFGGLYLTLEMWYPCKMRIGSKFCKFRKKYADCYNTMALFRDDKDKTVVKSKTKKSSKVVIIDEQIADNDTQRKQDDKTTINIDCVSYDVNTGVSTVASDRKG